MEISIYPVVIAETRMERLIGFTLLADLYVKTGRSMLNCCSPNRRDEESTPYCGTRRDVRPISEMVTAFMTKKKTA